MSDHLSATQISMYLRCPRQYEFRYIHGIKRPGSGALLLGSSYHAALEENFEQKIESHIDMATEDVLDVYRYTFNKKKTKEEYVLEEPEHELIDTGVALVADYQMKIAPVIQPIQVENKFSIDIDGREVIGVVDLETDDRLIEHKTANKSWSEGKPHQEVQATIYSMVVDKPIEYHIAVKTQKPKIQILSTSRTDQQREWVKELIKGIDKGIQSGVFYPNPTGNLCSPKWCGYWDLCKNS